MGAWGLWGRIEGEREAEKNEEFNKSQFKKRKNLKIILHI